MVNKVDKMVNKIYVKKQ